MKKQTTMFYHPDECDCVECLARREPGGLDFDPTNDDAEFEAHEQELLEDREMEEQLETLDQEAEFKKHAKEIGGKMKIRKNQTIKFSYPSDLTGLPMILTGTVLGFGEAVRKKWPEEMGEASDDMMLVWRRDVYGNTFHHAVHPSEVIEEPVAVIKKDSL